MKKSMAIFMVILSTSLTASAQMKVANYSYGTPGTDTFEQFSFWTKDGKRTDLSYTYGKDRKEVKLNYLGSGQIAGKSGFNVQFPNGHILYIIPTNMTLKVTDAQKKYQKTFGWYYEGPVNGIGTFCTVCAEDDKEAMRLIRATYLN